MAVSKLIRLFKSRENRWAALVALVADCIQIVILPLFALGGASPADTMVDVITALVMIRLLGWHWAFLPTLLAELVPGLDLFPTWTAAVLYVAWQSPPPAEPEMRTVRLSPKRFLNS